MLFKYNTGILSFNLENLKLIKNYKLNWTNILHSHKYVSLSLEVDAI